MDALTGQIERITFQNEENGFTIARVRVYGRRDLVTVVGNLANPKAGTILEMTGTWDDHPTFGDQFKVDSYRVKVPATVHGIQKYLGAGMIPGIGPAMARRIVQHFGEKTLDVIASDIGRLTEVTGIGEKRIQMIQQAWAEQKEIRDVMIFLQDHGVSTGYAAKIFKQYRNRSIEIVRDNPYRLAVDIIGIGFVTADRIAENLGIDKNAPERIRAGIIFVLNQMAADGHVYYPYERLVQKCREMLMVDKEAVKDGLAGLIADKSVIAEDMAAGESTTARDKAVYLPHFHYCETNVAVGLKALISDSLRRHPLAGTRAESALNRIRKSLDITLADNQASAIRCAMQQKVMVITGGPGTGKTTIINVILKLFQAVGARVLLAAPTGRAAKRMSESTGFAAKTIHRLLEFSFTAGGFQRNEENSLVCDLLIVDEMSMVDTVLMHHLVKAIPLMAAVVLVGDVNQIPSVGSGNVLHDIIASGQVPVVKLQEIFRQARESRIIVNAHRINAGNLPDTDAPSSRSDFYFIEKDDPEQVKEIVLRMVARRIPARFGFNPTEDIQVLTPMHKGVVGAANLNRELQKVLNPSTDEGVAHGVFTYRPGDKVMQVRNNYDKDVFNGDVGSVLAIDRVTQRLLLSFDQREVAYAYTELDEITLAYAISVHKSQGSEYPVVVMPIMTQHFILLQRNLLYTAVTRGKKLVVLVGSRKALAIAVKNDKTQRRYTHLEERLRGRVAAVERR